MPCIAGRLLVSCLLRIRNIAKPVSRINWNYLSSHGCAYLFPRASVVVVLVVVVVVVVVVVAVVVVVVVVVIVVIVVIVVVVVAEGSLEFRSQTSDYMDR